MSRAVRFFNVVLLFVGSSLLYTSCGFFGGGGGRPTSIAPGQASTATGIAYNEDSSFQVRDFEACPRIDGGQVGEVFTWPRPSGSIELEIMSIKVR